MVSPSYLSKPSHLSNHSYSKGTQKSRSVHVGDPDLYLHCWDEWALPVAILFSAKLSYQSRLSDPLLHNRSCCFVALEMVKVLPSDTLQEPFLLHRERWFLRGFSCAVSPTATVSFEPSGCLERYHHKHCLYHYRRDPTAFEKPPGWFESTLGNPIGHCPSIWS